MEYIPELIKPELLTLVWWRVLAWVLASVVVLINPVYFLALRGKEQHK